MTAQDWLGYVGAVTGIVGAATGVVGAILGYKGYRKANEAKSLDLRLALRRSEHDVQQVVQGLPGLLQQAMKSRQAVNAALGLARTGAFEQWKANWRADVAAVDELVSKLPTDRGDEYRGLSEAELESLLVAVHVLDSRARRLEAQYVAELAADDRERDHIRADQRKP